MSYGCFLFERRCAGWSGITLIPHGISLFSIWKGLVLDWFYMPYDFFYFEGDVQAGHLS